MPAVCDEVVSVVTQQAFGSEEIHDTISYAVYFACQWSPDLEL
jgi:hypothetical protein